MLTIVDLHEQAITRREANIRSALSEFVRDRYNQAWDWGSTDLPVDLESPRVLEAEYLGSEVIGHGNPAACKFTARIQIEGVMRKEQWFSDSDSEVQLWDGEINEHYVSVYVERIVEFDVEVDVDEAGEVDDVETTAVHL